MKGDGNGYNNDSGDDPDDSNNSNNNNRNNKNKNKVDNDNNKKGNTIDEEGEISNSDASDSETNKEIGLENDIEIFRLPTNRRERYKLQFNRETNDEIEQRKRQSRLPLIKLKAENGLIVDYNDVYDNNR